MERKERSDQERVILLAFFVKIIRSNVFLQTCFLCRSTETSPCESKIHSLLLDTSQFWCNRLSMSQIEFLHVLRGCAALLVVLEHLCIVFWYNKAAVAHLTNPPAVPETVQPPLSTRLVFSFGYEALGFNELWNLSSFAIALFYLISSFVHLITVFSAQDRSAGLPGSSSDATVADVRVRFDAGPFVGRRRFSSGKRAFPSRL